MSDYRAQSVQRKSKNAYSVSYCICLNWALKVFQWSNGHIIVAVSAIMILFAMLSDQKASRSGSIRGQDSKFGKTIRFSYFSKVFSDGFLFCLRSWLFGGIVLQSAIIGKWHLQSVEKEYWRRDTSDHDDSVKYIISESIHEDKLRLVSIFCVRVTLQMFGVQIESSTSLLQIECTVLEFLKWYVWDRSDLFCGLCARRAWGAIVNLWSEFDGARATVSDLECVNLDFTGETSQIRARDIQIEIIWDHFSPQQNNIHRSRDFTWSSSWTLSVFLV